MAFAAACVIAVSTISGAAGSDLSTAQAGNPFKFCLFRFGLGLTDDEKHIIAKMLAEADGSRNSRKEIFDKYNEMCTGPEYQGMTSCISFAEQLNTCIVLLLLGEMNGQV